MALELESTTANGDINGAYRKKIFTLIADCQLGLSSEEKYLVKIKLFNYFDNINPEDCDIVFDKLESIFYSCDVILEG